MSSAADLPSGDPSPRPSHPSDSNNGNSDEIDSLPSTETDDSLDEEHAGESDAEREWRESLQQLELLLTMVLVPYLGKYFGRKAAYWGKSTTTTGCH